jgi:hypothetical protein
MLNGVPSPSDAAFFQWSETPRIGSLQCVSHHLLTEQQYGVFFESGSDGRVYRVIPCSVG